MVVSPTVACTGQARVWWLSLQRIRLRSVWWLAAPDKRPMGQPIPSVPLNPLKRRTVRKPPWRKKIATQVFGGRRFAARVPVDPEPTAGRKHPALLALSSGTIGAGLSCPFPLDLAVIPWVLFAVALVAMLFALLK
jgi:hypothetical protein